MSDTIKAPRLNKVLLSGRIANDIELKHTGKGTGFVKFTLAVDKSFKDANGNWQNEASFFDCVAWDKTAETLNEKGHKGSPIIVDGKLEARTWTDKDGNKRKSVEVIVSYVEYLEKQATSQEKQDDTSLNVIPEPDITDDDVPF